MVRNKYRIVVREYENITYDECNVIKDYVVQMLEKKWVLFGNLVYKDLTRVDVNLRRTVKVIFDNPKAAQDFIDRRELGINQYAKKVTKLNKEES